jgi:hypothetical protein
MFSTCVCFPLFIGWAFEDYSDWCGDVQEDIRSWAGK